MIPRFSKYRAVKVTTDTGEKFDSKAEARRWQYLKLLERGGAIRELRRQVPYELLPSQRDATGKARRARRYIADFVYVQDGKTIVEDVKGMRTPEYTLKRDLLLWRHGITISEVQR